MTKDIEKELEKKTRYGELLHGKIVNVNKDKGYGFITSPDRKFVRFFFHWSALLPTTTGFEKLEKGSEVSFTEAYNDRGARAVKIDVLVKK